MSLGLAAQNVSLPGFVRLEFHILPQIAGGRAGFDLYGVPAVARVNRFQPLIGARLLADCDRAGRSGGAGDLRGGRKITPRRTAGLSPASG